MTPSRISVRQADLAALLAITLMVLGLYLPSVLRGKTLLDNPALLDVSIFFYPDVSWAAQAWWQGEFPLWNPHSTFGAPLLGFTHTGAMYPVTVVLYGLIPYLSGGSIGIIFHSLLLALLFYAALRQLRVPPLPAVAGGLMAPLSGMFFGMLYMIPAQGSLAWAVAFMIAFRALVERATLPRMLACIVSLALSAVAGDPEFFAFGVMTVGLMMFLERLGQVRQWPRVILLFLFSAIIGVLVVLPFFFAGLENAFFSLRGPLMPFKLNIESTGLWDRILPTWWLPLRYFSHLFVPMTSYNHGLSPMFQGVLVAPAFLVALARSRRDRVSSGLVLTWLVLLFYIILSEASWSRELVARLPLVGMLKISTKAIAYLHLLVLLVVFRMLQKAASSEGWGLRLTLSLVLMIGGIAILVAQPWCLGGKERYVLGVVDLVVGAAFGVGTLRRKVWFNAARLVGVFSFLMAAEVLLMASKSGPSTDRARWELPPALARLQLNLGDGTRFAIFEKMLPKTVNDQPALFGIFGVNSRGCNFSGPSRAYPAWAFLYQSLINDGFIVEGPRGKKYLNVYSLGNPGYIRRDRMHLFNLAGVRLILSRDQAVPFTSPYSLLKTNALLLNAGMGSLQLKNQPTSMTMTGPTRLEAGLSSMPGDRLVLEGVARAPGTLSFRVRKKGEGEGELLLAREVSPRQKLSIAVPLDALNRGGDLILSWEPLSRHEATIEFSYLSIENPARPFQRFFESGGIELFTNRDALPRAFVVHEALVAKGLTAEMKEIADPTKFFPDRVVILSDPLAETIAPTSASSGPSDEARITNYRDNLVEMTARVRTPGILVFTDTYFPGWKARINQGSGWAETRIVRADLAFRAIRIPAGLSRIEWSYEPASFRVGLWVSVASILSLVIMATIWTLGRRGRRRTSR